MNEQLLFKVYSLFIVGVIAQSLLAWEWGSKGLDRLRREGITAKIWFAFALFAVGGI